MRAALSEQFGWDCICRVCVAKAKSKLKNQLKKSKQKARKAEAHQSGKLPDAVSTISSDETGDKAEKK
jgi:hypothetical protein